MERFIIQDSEIPNHLVVTDQENGNVIIFEKGKFNETQKLTSLNDTNPNDFMEIAKQMREVGEWLNDNHKDKI